MSTTPRQPAHKPDPKPRGRHLGERLGYARLAAAVGIVVGIILCYRLHKFWELDSTAQSAITNPVGPESLFVADAAAQVFLLVISLCAVLVLLTRGLGARVGLVLGLGTGLLAAIGLALHFPAPTYNLVAFVVISTGVVGFLGYLAGGWEIPIRAHSPTRQVIKPDAPEKSINQSMTPVTSPDRGVMDKRVTRRPPSGLAEELLDSMITDFSQWIESEAGQRSYSDPPDNSAFDQFVRTTLRERLGATGVRVYEISLDGERLEPLTRENHSSGTSALESETGEGDGLFSARAGLVGHTVTTGYVHIAGDPVQGAFLRELAEMNYEKDPTSKLATRTPPQSVAQQHWAWLLPLRMAKCTCVLVAIQQVKVSVVNERVLAEAVRNVLQLCWRQIGLSRTLWRFMHTDRQSGMLNRTELLSRIEETARSSMREGEPLMVLALAVEGLRRLDDTGRWSQRDLLVQRLGQVLRQKVRSDDLLGRFSDDRFVVVLRRLDSALGTLVAENLIETMRSSILDIQEQAGGGGSPGAGTVSLRLRAGLAGSGLATGGQAVRPFATFDAESTTAVNEDDNAAVLVDGKVLLERALGLLDYARQQRIDIATDLMKGLPKQLAREGVEPETSGSRNVEHQEEAESEGAENSGQQIQSNVCETTNQPPPNVTSVNSVMQSPNEKSVE